MGMLCNLSKQTNSFGNSQNALACSCGWVGGGQGGGIRIVSVPHSVLPIPFMSSVLIIYVQNNMHCFAFLYHLLHHMKHISRSWSFLFVTCFPHYSVSPMLDSWAFDSKDLISNSPYCLPNDSPYVSLENLVWDHLVFPLIFIFILITCLYDIV